MEMIYLFKIPTFNFSYLSVVLSPDTGARSSDVLVAQNKFGLNPCDDPSNESFDNWLLGKIFSLHFW